MRARTNDGGTTYIHTDLACRSNEVTKNGLARPESVRGIPGVLVVQSGASFFLGKGMLGSVEGNCSR